ncbi:unnamed protein product [Urochloa humidicola]
MHANVGDIDLDLTPFLKRYKDGRIERLLRSPFVAASDDPTSNRGVATRDVVIDHGTGVSARRLPLVIYIHGGSFCTESAFCRTYHRYATSLAVAAGALVVSVEYRFAPEHPIPTAYDDAWSALQWAAASLADDPWLVDHADPRRTFIAGDSAGGNIAYHTAVRASRDGGTTDIEGLIMVQPYFWGTERLPSEAIYDGEATFPAYGVDWLWPFVTAVQAGNDDPRINPSDEEIASLTCRRVLIAVAQKDTLRERGIRLLGRIRDYYMIAGGEATLVESEGEDHGFHLYRPLRVTSKKLMESIVHFINQPPAPELNGGGMHHLHAWEGKKINRTSAIMTAHQPIWGVPRRPFMDIFDYGMDMKHHCCGPTCMAAYGGASKLGGGRGGKTAAASQANYGLFTDSVRPKIMRYKGPLAATLPGGTQVIKNFF